GRARPAAAPPQLPRRLATPALPAAHVPAVAVPDSRRFAPGRRARAHGLADAGTADGGRRRSRRPHYAARGPVYVPGLPDPVAVGLCPYPRLDLGPLAAGYIFARDLQPSQPGARPPGRPGAAGRRPRSERLAGLGVVRPKPGAAGRADDDALRPVGLHDHG